MLEIEISAAGVPSTPPPNDTPPPDDESGELHPAGSIRQPWYAAAVMAVLMTHRGTPLRTAEVTARLGELDGFLEYAESSVTKVLNDLGRLKLVTNLRGKGYWVPS
jgi:hypothetical protein